MGIPKILHQTVKDKKNIPEKWSKCQQTWLELHPEPAWTYYLWDDQDNDIFVQKNYPMFYQLYLDLPYSIERVDLVRYLYLHQYGGWYADMDTEAIKPIDALCYLEEKTIVMGHKSPIFRIGSSNVECAFMGSAPGEPFWILVIHAIHQSLYTPALSKRLVSIFSSVDVLMTTGPFLLDSVVRSCPPAMRLRIQVFPEAYFFSDPTISRDELPPVAYTIHHSDTSWVPGMEFVFGRMVRNTIGQIVMVLLFAMIAIIAFLALAFFFSSITNRLFYNSKLQFTSHTYVPQVKQQT